MSDSTPHGSIRRAPTGRRSARTSGSRATPSARPAGALRGRRASACARVPWWAWLALFVAAFSLFPVVETSGYVRRVAFDTVLYMLLALGLNVVVGWGGLLDLGFVAFYGIGAYAYAILDSPHSASTCRRSCSVPLVVVVGALAGLVLGLPSRRLTGDYLAIVTLFFLQLFQTRDTTNWQTRHRRPVRDPQRRPVQPLGGHQLVVAARRRLRGLVPLRRARVLRRRLRRAALPEPLAHRPRVALAARGPARGRGDGHAGQLAEAAELRLRRSRRRADRHALRRAVRRTSSRSPSTSCC